MMKQLCCLFVFLCPIIAFSQAPPQGVNYQAVARDAAGAELANTALTVRIGVYTDAAATTQSYEETHNVTTNAFGLFNLVIGQGTQTSAGAFSTIAWASSAHYLKVEIDMGTGFVNLGTTQLMSVPYALYAGVSGNGPVGATGPTGSAGTNGATGATGPTGANGATGATGPTGTAGTNGTNGATGATGPSGTNGTNGVTGATGVTGPSGTNGIDGLHCWDLNGNGVGDVAEDINVDGFWNAIDCAGATGATGATGTAGVNGATGATGPSGTNGTNGATGATGPSGTNGTNGATGATGPTGPTGTAGTNGTNGATGATGPSGTNGATGATGPSGTNGTNGATGPTGPTGPTWTISNVSFNANGTISMNTSIPSNITSGNAAWTTTGNSGTNPTTNYIGTSDAQPLVFRTGGSERMRIDAAGNVGIGTTPSVKLDVNGGSARIFDTNNASLTAFSSGPTSNSYVSLVAQAGTQREWRIMNDGGIGGALRFMDVTNGAERMVILANGDIGVGTTPGAKFQLLQTSSGSNGGHFVLNNTGATGNAFYAESNGASGNVIYAYSTNGARAGLFQINNATSIAHTLQSEQYGLGRAGHFEVVNTSNNTDALHAATNGMGAAMRGYSTGLGAAGEFQIANSANGTGALRTFTNGSGGALEAFNNGSGRAGFFQIGQTGNSSNALEVLTYGTGIAGKFNIVNNTNSANALEVSTNGTGFAGAFFGPVFIRSAGTTSATNALTVQNASAAPLVNVNSAGDVVVSGYTQLGTSAPAIKTLKLTGTTSTAANGSVSVAHGLNPAKILSVEVLVEYTTNNWVPPGYTINSGYEFNWYISGGDIVVWNKNGSSASILSKPFKIFITYEQ